MDKHLIIIQTDTIMPSGLSGEIRNVTGEVDIEFMKAIEGLMIKHKINAVNLYWAKFLGE